MLFEVQKQETNLLFFFCVLISVTHLKKCLRTCKQLLDFLWAIHCLAINTGCVPFHYYMPMLTSIYTLEKWHDWLFSVRQQQKNLGNKKFVIKSLEKCSFHFVKLNGHFSPRIQFDWLIDSQLVHLFYYFLLKKMVKNIVEHWHCWAHLILSFGPEQHLMVSFGLFDLLLIWNQLVMELTHISPV